MLLAHGLAHRAVVAQRLEQAHLPLAQVVGFRRCGGILAGLHVGRLARPLGGGPAEPGVAHAPHQAPVVRPLRARFGIVGAGQLLQSAVAQVAHEDVAVARERHARAGGVVDRRLAIDGRARGAVQAHRGTAADGLRPDVDDIAAGAFEFVIGPLAIP